MPKLPNGHQPLALKTSYRPIMKASVFKQYVNTVNKLPLRLGASLPVLPSSASLRTDCPKPYDQGNASSCTANAENGAYDTLTRGLKPKLSRMHLYYGERKRENGGGPLSDEGADPYDGLEFFRENGICEEAIWPYNVAKINEEPPSGVGSATKYKISKIGRLPANDLQSLKSYIAKGIPIVLGIALYQNFYGPTETATGQIQLPGRYDMAMGGHAVLAVGYDDTTQRALILNSWGSNWGDKGFFTLPYQYLTTPGLTLCQSFIEQV